MTDFTSMSYIDAETRARAEARARMSSPRRLLRNLMRAAMRNGSGLYGQNDAVERFIKVIDEMIVDPKGEEIIDLIHEFVGEEMLIAARELYRALWVEERRTTTAKRQPIPREPNGNDDDDRDKDDKDDKGASKSKEGAGARPARPSGAVGQVARRMLQLWDIDINGQPLRYAPAREVREHARMLGIRGRFLMLMAHGVPDDVLIGDAKTDEDVLQADQLSQQEPQQ